MNETIKECMEEMNTLRMEKNAEGKRIWLIEVHDDDPSELVERVSTIDKLLSVIYED